MAARALIEGKGNSCDRLEMEGNVCIVVVQFIRNCSCERLKYDT